MPGARRAGWPVPGARMRKRTMQTAIDAMDRGDPLPPKLEAEVEHEYPLAEELHSELHQFLLAWHLKHPEVEDVIEPVLSRALFVRMVARGCTVEDVADYARAAARLFEKEGLELRRKAESRGRS